jgi:hypothetical protein
MCCQCARAGEQRRSRIDANDSANAGPACEPPGEDSCAAADFQHSGIWRERNRGEEGFTHRLLLRIAAARFEDIGETFLVAGVGQRPKTTHPASLAPRCQVAIRLLAPASHNGKQKR